MVIGNYNFFLVLRKSNKKNYIFKLQKISVDSCSYIFYSQYKYGNNFFVSFYYFWFGTTLRVFRLTPGSVFRDYSQQGLGDHMWFQELN